MRSSGSACCKTALKDDRFELYTQPVISVTGTNASGPAIEVLLRMHDDKGLIIMPGQFMHAAERYRIMTSVDRWVVQATFAALGQGAIHLPANRSCSINLSGQTLGEPAFLEFVVDCLDHSQIDPSRICFEINETVVMSDLDHAQRFIGVLHGIGCSFGLDNFGSGVGSFASVRDLSVDFVKIDGLYTRELDFDSLNHQVVSAITHLSKTFDFKVIAEQVEEQDDFVALRELGVEFIQGNYIQEPRSLQKG